MSEPDWDLVAKVLGVSRQTLPNTKTSITAAEKPRLSRAVDALSLPAPLTDEEWAAILPNLPAV
jgi:hypothetical protein